MVAATGAMMAVTTAPANVVTQTAGNPANGDAGAAAANGFVQMIAELLGDTAATAPVAAPSAGAPVVQSQGDKPSSDDANKQADVLADMLAAGMTLPYAPTPVEPPAPVVTNKSAGGDAVTSAVTNTATDAPISGTRTNTGVGTAISDAARMQQLSSLLTKDANVKAGETTTDGGTTSSDAARMQQFSPLPTKDTNIKAGEATTGVGTASGDVVRTQQFSSLLTKDTNVKAGETAKPEQGVKLAAVLNKNEAEVPVATTDNKSIDFDAKLQEAIDGAAAPVKPTATHHLPVEQLQQAVTVVRPQDAAVEPREQYTVHARVGSHEWVAELGNKLTLMNTQNTQSASLQLTPDNMGPVEVKIEVNQGHASVWFSADNADTRTALEQSLPKLREMFAAQGMPLTDAGVFGQRSQQQAPTPFSSGHSGNGAMSIDEPSIEDTVASRSLSLGLLDTYA